MNTRRARWRAEALNLEEHAQLNASKHYRRLNGSLYFSSDSNTWFGVDIGGPQPISLVGRQSGSFSKLKLPGPGPNFSERVRDLIELAVHLQ